MKKIPTLFERDWDGDRSRVVDKVHPGCEWVLAGEGVATRKYDGVCCMYDGVRWYKRRELKGDGENIGGLVPPGFLTADVDDVTGKVVGWVPLGHGSEDKFMREAVTWARDFFEETGGQPPFGTYEFLGPKSQGNVEKWARHEMIWHTAAEQYSDVPRTFEGLREWLAGKSIEGLVFHHEDGRMAKIKLRDFGLKRAEVASLAPAAEWLGL